MLKSVCASVLGSVFGSLVVLSAAFGQNVQTLPPANDSVAGTSGNSLPLANYTAGTAQVMYGADLLAGIPVGSVVTGIQFRLEKNFSSTFPTTGFTATRYDVRLAGSTLTPSTMSTVYATNMNNPVLVRSGTLSIAAGAYQWINNGAGVPEPWGPVIPFTTTYVYQGGPLVMELRMTSPSNTFGAYADVSNSSSQRSMLSDNDANATSSSGGLTTGGIIVRLNFVLPQNLAKGVTKVFVGEKFVGATAGGGDGVLAWTSGYTQEAVAAANQFDTIGPGSDFVGMAWRLSPGSVSNWPGLNAVFGSYDVQLSRSVNAPGLLSQTIAANVGADAVTVRSGELTFGTGSFVPRGGAAVAPFGPEVQFTNRYAYRGGSLLSVIRHSGQLTGVAGFFDALQPGGPGYNTDVQAWQSPTASTATATGGSPYLVTRFSVDAATISPLNQLSPTAGDLWIAVTPMYQTVLSASELKYIPVGSVINSLWLRQAPGFAVGPTSAVTASDFEMSVSTATQQPASMSLNFAANEGPDKVLVHDGMLTVPANTLPSAANGNFGKIVQFQKNFVYKGGPLCITIRHTGLSAAIGNPEAVKGTLNTNRSIYSFSVGAATGDFLSGGHTGTATKLGYIPSVMTPNYLATEAGNPANAFYMPGVGAGVVQVVVGADQLRAIDVGSAITGMSMRSISSTFPLFDSNLTRFDVTLSQAVNPPLSMSATYANNIGSDAVAVRSGAMTVPAGAFPGPGANGADNAWYVPFSRGYVYQGGDLCVTMRFDGGIWGGGRFDSGLTAPSTLGASRWSYNTSNDTSGNPWGPMAIRWAFTPRTFCPWDLNNDGVVEDSDFTIFLTAYNILDCTDGSMAEGCPADFNYDRVVDDADFTVFLGAYNVLVCP